VGRDGLFEGRVLTTSVLAARRCGHPGEADVVAAAPVAGDRAECREAQMPSVRRDTEAVDPGATHDRDSPSSLGPGPQDGERVVPDRDLPREPPFAHGGMNVLFLSREVDACEQKLRDV